MLEWLVFVELVVLGWVVRMWDKEWGDVVLEKGWGGENVVLWVKGFLVLERGTGEIVGKIWVVLGLVRLRGKWRETDWKESWGWVLGCKRWKKSVKGLELVERFGKWWA
ncbi:hypothetical protein ES703_55063 [subsurface metagenome]